MFFGAWGMPEKVGGPFTSLFPKGGVRVNRIGPNVAVLTTPAVDMTCTPDADGMSTDCAITGRLSPGLAYQFEALDNQGQLVGGVLKATVGPTGMKDHFIHELLPGGPCEPSDCSSEALPPMLTVVWPGMDEMGSSSVKAKLFMDDGKGRRYQEFTVELTGLTGPGKFQGLVTGTDPFTCQCRLP